MKVKQNRKQIVYDLGCKNNIYETKSGTLKCKIKFD